MLLVVLVLSVLAGLLQVLLSAAVLAADLLCFYLLALLNS